MSRVITHSGLYNDERGQRFWITQGLDGYTLVAGKQSLFRLRLDPALVDQIDSVFIRVDGIGRTTRIILSRADLIIGSPFPEEPNIGFIVRGVVFPRSGYYEFLFAISGPDFGELLKLSTGPVHFLPTKDLILNVVFGRHEGFFEPTHDWTVDTIMSMGRLGSMFPVRDGVSDISNNWITDGIRFMIGNPCDGYIEGYYPCVYEQTKRFNESNPEPYADEIHVTVEFRWGFYDQGNPAGYDPYPGGNSGRPPAPYSNYWRAAAVGGIYPPGSYRYVTAPLIAQEIGHNFGLVSPNSPLYDGGGHSTEVQIGEPWSAFDFRRLRDYYPPSAGMYLGDIMSAGYLQGNDSTLLNRYDWEDLRNGLVNLPSASGTEHNPAYLTEISPSKISLNDPMIEPQLPTKQEYYEKTLKAPAEGCQWEWTSQGVQLIKPANLGKESNPPISEKLHRILSQLEKDEADIVYLPIGMKPSRIARRNDKFTYSKENVENILSEAPKDIDSMCPYSGK